MKQNYPLHIGLFLVTVFTTMMAGAELASAHPMFMGNDALGLQGIWRGIPFSFAFLAFLTVHEFGHFFTAVYHKVKCSLPYYIPMFLPFSALNIGSLGAVIRIREVPSSRRKYFDIGVAGPLAGFFMALGMLLYGFLSLTPVDATVLGIHPEYVGVFGGVPTEQQMAGNPDVLTFGGSLLFEGIKWLFHSDANFPPSFELMHYPFILAGFLGLFFTALNLLPIGQLDGGHVVYGLVGARRAGIVARVAIVVLFFFGGIGVFDETAFVLPSGEIFWEWISWVVATRLLYLTAMFLTMQRIFKDQPLRFHLGIVAAIVLVQSALGFLVAGLEGDFIWIFYPFMVSRLVGADHPVAVDDAPLTLRQKAMGILAILIFVLCFSPHPFTMG